MTPQDFIRQHLALAHLLDRPENNSFVKLDDLYKRLYDDEAFDITNL